MYRWLNGYGTNCADSVPFELVALEVDHYDESAKTTRVWGEKRKGRATPKDRVIVFAARAFAQDGGGAPVFAKRA